MYQLDDSSVDVPMKGGCMLGECRTSLVGGWALMLLLRASLRENGQC